MLKPISRRNLIKKLRKIGFEGPFSGGKHSYMTNFKQKITIPNTHGNKDIGIVLLKRVIKNVNMKLDEFNDL